MTFTNLYAQNLIGDEDEMNVILKNIQVFSELVMNSDFEGIGNTYTEDAKIFPTNKAIIEGREAITDYWKLPEGTVISYHKIIPEEIKIIGDEAYDFGYYEGATQKDGKESRWQGKYVIVWKKVGDDWKIYLDIWNRVVN
ncbi:MAG: hypothetical protein Aureis2KO_19450 [Aureisphaera sp.]